MDRETPKTNGHADVGISIRNGPMDEMEIDGRGSTPHANGVNGKRKARASLPNGRSYAESSESEDDKPISKRRKTSTPAKAAIDDDSDASDVPLVKKKAAKVQQPPAITAAQIGEDSDSDVPITTKLAAKKERFEKRAEKQAKQIRADEHAPAKKPKKPKAESDDEDIPLAKKKKVAKQATSASGKSKVKAEAASPAKKTKPKKEATEEDLEAEEEEEEYRWWEDPSKGDGTIKWKTLEHSGVVFPPPYEPLPKGVVLKYDGVPVKLHPDAEEIAGFYGAMLNSEVNVSNPTFNKNFFEDFQEMLKKTGGATDKDGNKIKIKSFDKCDFTTIFEYYDAERQKKKALPAAEKKAIKAAKDEAEAPYMYCLWDGRKQKVGNFRVEPPGLFRGRGEHPKTGRVKQRVAPEQITINIGKGAKVPKAPEGHKWKEVKHDQEGTWLAMWQENINNAYKYVMLAANSDVKGQSDHKKFEKARQLKKHIDRIRKDYTKELKAGMMADRQRATAVYLIDKFALRAGNEKGDDEADTVGCCSLKYEHVTLKPPNTVVFDFLGKDSIRFHDEVQVDEQVFKNLRIFKKPPKTEGDEIFDRLTTSALNKHLSTYMDGLTAKVFRTYNASWTMANLLKEMKAEGTIPEKVKQYNDANREVAILCNHKRTVAKGHEGQMEKLGDKINGMRYHQWRLKQMMLDVDPKLKKKHKSDGFFDLPEDMDQEMIERLQAGEVEEQRQKITKKFEKENEKLVADGSRAMKESELKDRLGVADELQKKYRKENKTKKVEAEGKSPSVEKLEQQVEKLSQRIEVQKLQLEDKDQNKEVALGTSKIVSP